MNTILLFMNDISITRPIFGGINFSVVIENYRKNKSAKLLQRIWKKYKYRVLLKRRIAFQYIKKREYDSRGRFIR